MEEPSLTTATMSFHIEIPSEAWLNDRHLDLTFSSFSFLRLAPVSFLSTLHRGYLTDIDGTSSQQQAADPNEPASEIGTIVVQVWKVEKMTRQLASNDPDYQSMETWEDPSSQPQAKVAQVRDLVQLAIAEHC